MDDSRPYLRFQLLLEEAVQLSKCRKCGCMKGTLEALCSRATGASPASLLAGARDALRSLARRLEPTGYS